MPTAAESRATGLCLIAVHAVRPVLLRIDRAQTEKTQGRIGALRLAPEHDRSRYQNQPGQDGPRCPNFIEGIGRSAFIPGQSVRDRVVKDKCKNGAAPQKPGVESWRQEKNEGREPDEVLGANSRRENEKNDPSVGHRIPDAAAFNLSAPPGKREDGEDNEKFATSYDTGLPRSETNKTHSSEFGPAREPEQVAEAPDSPVAAV